MIKKIIIILFVSFFANNISFTKKTNIMTIGNKNAKITVKVFSSLTCPHCANFHNKIFDNLKKEYIDTNKVKFEHHGFPLDLAALNAEKILRCNLDTNKNFLLLNEIYKKQDSWAVGSDIKIINKSIKKIGKNFNLSEEKMNSCLENDLVQEEILNERIDAQKKYKISSTPTIYINNKKFEGPHEYKKFKKELDKFL